MKFRGDQVSRESYPEGKVLFFEGDQGNAVFIVETGSVEIFKTVGGEKVRLATLRAGELFGEMAIIDGSPRMATAVTLEPSIIARIPREMVEAKIAEADPFNRVLMNILIHNLREVHRIYAKRPRSADDFITSLAHNAERFGQCVATLDDAELAGKAKPLVAAITGALAELRTLLGGHDDRRRNVITDADLTH